MRRYLLFVICILLTSFTFFSQIDTNKLILYQEGDTIVDLNHKNDDNNLYVIDYKNYFKYSGVEIFSGEFYFSYERILTDKIGVELSAGITIPKPFDLTQKESFPYRIMSNTFKIGHLLRLEFRYFLNTIDNTKWYAGVHFGVQKYNNGFKTIESSYNRISLNQKELNQFNNLKTARVKIGYVLNFGRGPNHIRYLFDISAGIGIAHVNTLRFEEVITQDDVNDVYYINYPETKDNFIRFSPYLSLKLSRGFK